MLSYFGGEVWGGFEWMLGFVWTHRRSCKILRVLTLLFLWERIWMKKMTGDAMLLLFAFYAPRFPDS